MSGMWLCEGWTAFEGLLQEGSLDVAVGWKPWFLIRCVMVWGYPQCVLHTQ